MTNPVRTAPARTTLFLREASANFHDTGAVLPSSAPLAEALSSALDGRPRARTVLEVGGGTGSVTTALVRRLSPTDRIDVVESNPRFAAHLRTSPMPGRRDSGPRVTVHETRIELLHSTTAYDVIVSGLPFANFEPDVVASITDRYRGLLAPGGTVAYFSYLGTRAVRSVTPSRSQKRRHAAVERVLSEFRDGFDVESSIVWANLPPARVWILRDTTGGRS